MTGRLFTASILGAGALLVAAAAVPTPGLIGPASAQQAPAADQQRSLLLAIANAIASVAVDGERTAMAVNDASDRIVTLEERVRTLERRLVDMEKRLAELERKR